MAVEQALQFIESNEKEIFHLLNRLVDINTYTHNKDNVNKAAELIADNLKKYNIDYTRKKLDEYGDQLIANIKGAIPGKILLLGHYDTVHPPNTEKTHKFHKDETNVYGPGVSDMKAGIVSMIYIAATIKKFGIETCDIELLFTPDEEYGSPISRRLIKERAREANAAFILESGRPNGEVVTKRKGSAHFNFSINGKASHSGVAKEKGISAIEELGYKIVEIQKLNDTKKGISVNIGTIHGGTNSNVVAAEVNGTIHVGYPTSNDLANVKEQLISIFNTSFIDGTISELKGGEGIPPMEKHDGVATLFELVQKSAEKLNLNVSEKHEKGASDAGFVASLGTPTICGMGPVGGKWHSEEEYLVIDSLIPRFKLLFLSIISATEEMNKLKNSKGMEVN
ncbi:M20 family metallopeptidase [Virgibacillus halodenitrificans]|uniref:M20 family metallopeptidase n=1 Tax=Virgibacillus halodenitrificans TaxID=1482 RepID=UPI0007610DE3